MRVLITAPTGYVGRRLLARFAQESRVSVRVLTADARRLREELRPGIEVLEADPLEPVVLERAMRGIEVAYFPARFLSLDPGFDARNREFAGRFRDAGIEAGVRRIVHLGMPGDSDPDAGPPTLLSDVTGILGTRPDRIQTLALVPGVIVGPGSAFYEMAMSLVGRVPIIPLPRWTGWEGTFVALSDVVECLVRAAFLEFDGNFRIAIGAERMSFAEFLRLAARVRGVSPAMVPIPARIPCLSAAFLALATPFSYPLSLALVRHFLRTTAPARPAGSAVRPEFPPPPELTCEEAIRIALRDTEAAEVEGRWTDSLAGLSSRGAESEMLRARYRDVRRRDFGPLPPAAIYRSVLALGGAAGWFSFDFLWRVRGFLDKLLGGFGTSIGRRSPSDLRVGDLLDVWRVVDVVENRRLLLQAQMKVFGKAWLEFRIEGTTLIQTASYAPDGTLGTLYWFAMLPFHAFIFPDLLRGIVRRAGQT